MIKKFSFPWIFFIAISISILGLWGCQQASTEQSLLTDDQRIAEAFRNGTSDLWVESSGVVDRFLSDDLEGSRHQRFILRLDHGQTLLISHNIDIALRLNNLQKGDRVFFRGEYEWNNKGGVIHWTHHDPQGRYPGGWLEHKGQRYQ